MDTPARALNARERLRMELVRTFGTIGDPRLQEALSNLARTLAVPEADDRETAA
jgi:hypothetical protein